MRRLTFLAKRGTNLVYIYNGKDYLPCLYLGSQVLFGLFLGGLLIIVPSGLLAFFVFRRELWVGQVSLLSFTTLYLINNKTKQIQTYQQVDFVILDLPSLETFNFISMDSTG